MADSRTPERQSDFVCDCEEWMRSACAGELFYREHDGKRYCIFHFPGEGKKDAFNRALASKLEQENCDFAGFWFPEKLEFKRYRFRSEAIFAGATFSDVVIFSTATFLARANFSEARFVGKADFWRTTFEGPADYRNAVFEGPANFRGALFQDETEFASATFRGTAGFTGAKFQQKISFHSTVFEQVADFKSAAFEGKTHFDYTKFIGATDFFHADFSELTYFNNARFEGVARFFVATFRAPTSFEETDFMTQVDFRLTALMAEIEFVRATFADYVRFGGYEKQPLDNADRPLSWSVTSLNFEDARIEKPDRVSFHTVTLFPHWFVNVDARQFEFTDVKWGGTFEDALQALKVRRVSFPHRLLSIAYRRLALNAEENHRYEEASKFRYLAMDARLLEEGRSLVFWRLSWWYWLASGYGERPFQAFAVLIGIMLLCAALYTRVGFARWEPKLASEADAVVATRDDVGAPLKVRRALTYSAGVMTLQRPEPKPATTAAQTVVILETILGPVQAALLALAIRRKFMR